MTEINDLRERVEAAEARFGLIDEQQQHYSERLIGLIDTIEAQLAAARGEIEQQISENLRLSQENEELRSMLHSMLQAIEKKTFTETLQNLEARVSALVTAGAAGGRPAQPAAAASDTPVSEAGVPEAGSAEETGEPSRIDAFVDAEAEESAEAALIMDTPEIEEEPAAAQAETAPEAAPAAGDGAAAIEEPAEDALAFLDATAEEEAAPDPETAEPETDEEVMEDLAFQDEPAAAMSEVAFEDAPEAAAEEPAEPDAAAGMEADSEEPMAADSSEPETEAPEAVSEPVFDLAAALDDAAEPPGEAAAGSEAAPSVKEIIRRVGDLARELEKAETQRRASSAADGPEAEDEMEEAAPGAPPLGPPLDRVVNG